MNITPFLSHLVSSAVNRGYIVSISDGVIRVKISDDERLIIKQYKDGEIDCYISFNFIFRSIPKHLVYDFLFSIDEYGFRLYSGFNKFDRVGV
ncbi:hypothetical protein HRW30_000002 [Salmonella enterica]|nr:hypothetical protein [Salmonella enterica]EHB9442793.1 hypothetical protein [Salmonella enterica]EIM6956290.1 hypothetical protein [Salmonella enterica]